MKCVAIGGIPAVGKSTIVEQFFRNYSYWNEFKYKKLRGHYNKELNLFILGVYGESKFGGTDKLSMAVQPDFESYVVANHDKANILFEGDRLFSLNNIYLLNDYYELKVAIISSNLTEQRHVTRRDNQSSKFIKGRVTKLSNITKAYKEYITYENNEPEDIDRIFKHICSSLT
tara:strand:- start:821 stop:1339 length:519 start_codon:yes stop_codon:yes gene_type:complete